MLAKIDILNEQGLGERVYKWDANYVQDLQKYEWERSPVEIEKVSKQRLYPASEAGFAVWQSDVSSPWDVTKARVKFDKLAPSYASIYCSVSEDEAYFALVPFDKFIAKLKKDDVVTNIITKTWLDENAEYITKHSIAGDIDDVELDINLVYKRPVLHWPRDIHDIGIKTAKVSYSNIDKYYHSLTYETNIYWPHPIKGWANKLYYRTIYSQSNSLEWVQEHMGSMKDYEDLLKDTAEDFKGRTGFGVFPKNRQVTYVDESGNYAGYVNEMFLTLGLANEDYDFFWFTKDGYWCYGIKFNIAYFTPDISYNSVNDYQTENLLGLQYYSYGTWTAWSWVNSNREYSDNIDQWTYWQNAYSIYDYHYVSELDNTDSFGTVFGIISSENKFYPKLLTNDEIIDNGYRRIAGYTRGAPSYPTFVFSASKAHASIDGVSANISYIPNLEYCFWKINPDSELKVGWQDIRTEEGFIETSDGTATTRCKYPVYAVYYYPLDEIERFPNGSINKHDYPKSATAHYRVDSVGYIDFDINRLSIDFTGGFGEMTCYAITYETYENIIGIDETKKEQISSFNPNAYPKDEVQNGWKYTYKGFVNIVNSDTNMKAFTITSSNMNAYPRDGVQKTGNEFYWYKFAGLVRSTVETYFPNVIFDCTSRQSIGSSNSFAIGNIGGGTCEFTVLKPYTEVIKYKNYDINVYYTYKGTFGSAYYLDGQYTIKEIEEIGPNKVRVMAYDNCYRLDCSAMPLIENIQNHETIVKKLFYYICAYCDIPYYGNELILNGELTTGDLSTLDANLTCRQLLEWVAQISGTVAVCDNKGFMVLKSLERPALSRGSYDVINRSLKVSKIPIVVPVGIKIQNAANQTVVIGELTEWENRILDWTSNVFFKANSTSTSELAAQNVLNQFTKIEDIYSFTCDLADNRYEIGCGDSWVVESKDIEPRRGIITDKAISASGLSLVSSVGIESEYAPFYSKEQATINLLINQIDAVFKNLVFEGIKLVDPLTKEVLSTETQHYDLTLENSVFEYDGKVFDLSAQWRNLIVNPDEWVEIMVDGEVWKVRIYEDYLQLYCTNTLPEAYKTINLQVNISDNISFYSWRIDGDLTPAQISATDEITIIPHYGYSLPTSGSFSEDNEPFTIKFPKPIGAFLYEAKTKGGAKNTNYTYTGYNYDSYSVWEPQQYSWYPSGNITIDGAYPKSFTFTIDGTSIKINIGRWCVPKYWYDSYKCPYGSGYVPYVTVDGYKLWQYWDINDSFPPSKYKEIRASQQSYCYGLSKVARGYSWMVYDENNTFVGVLGWRVRITNYDSNYAYGNEDFYWIDADGLPKSVNVVTNWVKEENVYDNVYNPVLHLNISLSIAPKVKNVILYSGEYTDWFNASMILLSELPFDVTQNPVFYNIDNCAATTFDWTEAINDGSFYGLSTLNGTLGFMINGYWSVPKEVNWDFNGDFYNQTIYAYSATDKETYPLAFKYYKGEFIYTGMDWSDIPTYYEPITQTLMIGREAN